MRAAGEGSRDEGRVLPAGDRFSELLFGLGKSAKVLQRQRQMIARFQCCRVNGAVVLFEQLQRSLRVWKGVGRQPQSDIGLTDGQSYGRFGEFLARKLALDAGGGPIQQSAN